MDYFFTTRFDGNKGIIFFGLIFKMFCKCPCSKAIYQDRFNYGSEEILALKKLRLSGKDDIQIGLIWFNPLQALVILIDTVKALISRHSN